MLAALDNPCILPATSLWRNAMRPHVPTGHLPTTACATLIHTPTYNNPYPTTRQVHAAQHRARLHALR